VRSSLDQSVRGRDANCAGPAPRGGPGLTLPLKPKPPTPERSRAPAPSSLLRATTNESASALVLAKVAFPTAERHDPDVGPAVRLARGEQPHTHHARLKEALRQPDVQRE